MKCGAEVFGVDADQTAIDRVRAAAAAAAPNLPSTNFSVARLGELPFPADHFGASSRSVRTDGYTLLPT